MRRPIIAGNWKENKTNNEAIMYLVDLLNKTKDVDDKDIIIAPSFVALSDCTHIVKGSNIYLSAQNMFYENFGAFTGAISPVMIKPFCNFVIVGHSERRIHFHALNEDINRRVVSALKNGLKPILCVGETSEEKENGRTFQVIKERVMSGLKGVEKEDVSDVVIAYEPIWAISGGDVKVKPATPDDAQMVQSYIRSLLREKYGTLAENVRILYGGSVKPENAASLMSMSDVDGLLVGGASLDVEKFEKIIKYDS